MPALRFSVNIVSPSPPSAAGLKPWESKKEHRIRFFPTGRRPSSVVFKRRAALSSSPSSLADYDLYDLLGLDSSSDQSQIKSAYRALQKQCHPDVAGAAGHEMAIVLNEAYAVLSDPRSRSTYDKERARKIDFHGFTGKPMYSAWYGPESEQRAVFVDEVRCVGCLKCALLARNTFAIETVYGRARVVGQWADSEGKILDAIDACPVDCISIVARSDLPALEFCMSKQPRGPVRLSVGASAGNIFADVKKFQKRYSEMEGQNLEEKSEVSDMQREARASAVRGIRSLSNWWFRQAGRQNHGRHLVVFAGKRTGSFSHTKRLQEAAAKWRANGPTRSNSRLPPANRDGEEYWTPLVLPSSPQNTASGESVQSRQSPGRKTNEEKAVRQMPSRSLNFNSAMLWVPELVAVIAAGTVGGEGGEITIGGGLEQHVAGAMALEIVNSSWMRSLLAGITWYLIAAAAVGLVAAVQRKED